MYKKNRPNCQILYCNGKYKILRVRVTRCFKTKEKRAVHLSSVGKWTARMME